MRLFTQSRNSAGERVRIALGLKGLAYEYAAVGRMPPGAYRRINPQGLMPALQVADGTVIAQSTAILEYIEETHPSPALLPANPVGRAQARAFGQAIAADLHPLNNHRVRRRLGHQFDAAEGAILDWVRHWTAETLTALEAAVRPDMPFCFGDRPGWADLHLVPQLSTARRFGCDLAPYPRLRAVEAACLPLAAFQAARAEAQPDYTGAVVTSVRPR